MSKIENISLFRSLLGNMIIMEYSKSLIELFSVSFLRISLPLLMYEILYEGLLRTTKWVPIAGDSLRNV